MKEHKEKIQKKIESHKKDICDVKALYRDKVSLLKEEFEQLIAQDYPSLFSIKNIKSSSSKNQKPDKKCSIRVEKERKYHEDLECEIKDQEVM